MDACAYRVDWARRAVDRGWRLLPVRGKKAILENWPNLPAPSLEDVLEWARAGNLGLQTGSVSNLLVVDVDTAKGGVLDGLPRTPTVETGGGGLHYYFASPVPPLRNSAGKLAPHVDTRGEGGYVVFVGSIHPETRRAYRWATGLSPDDVDLAVLPPTLIEVLRPRRSSRAVTTAVGGTPSAYGRAALDAESDRVATASPGRRNHILNTSAFSLGQLVGGGELTEDMVASVLRAAALAAGLEEREIDRTIRSGLTAGIAQPRFAPRTRRASRSGAEHSDSSTQDEESRGRPARAALTDLGNARRLVHWHGRDLHHTSALGWLHWDSCRWSRDQVGEVMRRAKDSIERIACEAVAAQTPGEVKALTQWATRSQAVGRIQATVTLAASEPRVALLASDFDNDPLLLNCRNGTLDLRTGTLRPHRRDDLLTKVSPVEFDPAAQAPTWERFLDRIMAGNTALIDYLQRLSGYALTADVREQAWVIFHGGGQNGKSTFLVILLDLLGDYGKSAPPELLLAKRSDRHPAELADLFGCRVTVCMEVEQGRRLAEAMVKQITGGDRLRARFLFHDFFEFSPTHKIILATNHKPRIRGTDLATWRRIHLVPFTVTIPKEEQDRALLDKLRAELRGILAWAVVGCLRWQAEGLTPPEEVRAATSEYRNEQDVVARFLADDCLLDAGAKSPAAQLYEAYKKWCESSGEQVLPQRDFGEELAKKGLENKKHGHHRRWWWFGIGLLTDPDRRPPLAQVADQVGDPEPAQARTTRQRTVFDPPREFD